MTTKRRRVSRLLFRKSQIDVDFILGYIVFIGFMLYMINFIFSMTGPFKDAINFNIQERRAYMLMQDMSVERLSVQNFEKLCNNSYDFISSYSVEYVIFGFKTPYYDTPAENYDVLIQRAGNSIRLLAKKSCSIQFVVPDESNAFVNKISLDESDNVTEKKDFFNNKVITIEIKTEENKEKEAIISLMKDSFVTFSIESNGLENVFIGKTKVTDKCGKKSASSNHFYVEDLSLISDQNDKLPVAIKVDAWW